MEKIIRIIGSIIWLIFTALAFYSNNISAGLAGMSLSLIFIVEIIKPNSYAFFNMFKRKPKPDKNHNYNLYIIEDPETHDLFKIYGITKERYLEIIDKVLPEGSSKYTDQIFNDLSKECKSDNELFVLLYHMGRAHSEAEIFGKFNITKL